MYDYIIVGSGLYGAVFAQQLKENNISSLVIEKRDHIGGNIYTKKIEDINVHIYGPHIFHTNDKEVWDYVNRFSNFNNFRYEPIANYKGELYNLPFNMNTFYQMWNVADPKEVVKIIDKQKKVINREPRNLEEQAIFLVGEDIYNKLIKGYTEKQWGRDCKDLPPFIIKRLPVRLRFDNNYFNHVFQGVPSCSGSYAELVEKMLEGVEVKLNTNYLSNKKFFDSMANKIVYTGPIDEYFNCCLGRLQYRSLRFEHEILDIDNFQGVAGMNFTDRETPYTRIVEHKHFEFGNQKKTVITREYPIEYGDNNEPYYPINDNKNNSLYNEYLKLANCERKVIFGGRLAEYKYYDMDVVVRKALDRVKKELE